jgi:hypothetical protein
MFTPCSGDEVAPGYPVLEMQLLSVNDRPVRAAIYEGSFIQGMQAMVQEDMRSHIRSMRVEISNVEASV